MNLYDLDNSTYIANRHYADGFNGFVMWIAAMALAEVKIADEEADTKRCTDAELTMLFDGLVAMRVRNDGYKSRYGRGFTIRAKTKFNQSTEIHKILAGFGQVMVYCWASPENKYIQVAYVINLNVFRETVKDLDTALKMGDYCENKDRDGNPDGTALLGFNYDQFPPEMVLARFDLHGRQKWMFGMLVDKGIMKPEDVPVFEPLVIPTPQPAPAPVAPEVQQATFDIPQHRLRMQA
jgi:hypothetical protein